MSDDKAAAAESADAKMISQAKINAIAEALWQQECIRAFGRHHYTPWSEVPEREVEKWEGLARAAVRAIENLGTVSRRET